MSHTKSPDHMVNDYYIGEGDMIGYLPAEYGNTDKKGFTLNETPLVAGADLIKGRVVEVTDVMKVKHTSASSGKILGVAMFDTKKDDPCSVQSEGLFKLVAASAITAGDKITSAADGKVATSGTNSAGTCGIALTTAKTNEYVFVKFTI